jgi:glucose-6-phosphate dehydrogenase assembly protein OpcA
MADHDAVYPLIEPSEVDVSEIESELEEMWRSAAAAEKGENAVMRTAAFTLVYAVRDTYDGGIVKDMLVDLTLRHPARTILVRFSDLAANSMRAWVTVFCHRPAPSLAPVCADFITLETSGNDPSSVVSTLLSLFLSGMPTVLVWDSSLPSDHPVLLKIGPEIERVITSVIPPCSSASKLSILFQLTVALGNEPVVTDLLECFVRAWQLAVARIFDADPAAAQTLREIRLGYNGDKIPAEMLLLAGWISAVLKWKVSRILLRGHVPAILFDGDRSISFISQRGDSAVAFAEFVSTSAQGDKTLRCEEPVCDNRLIELLHVQLQIWGRDPLRDESLRRARLWLKELLFS